MITENIKNISIPQVFLKSEVFTGTPALPTVRLLWIHTGYARHDGGAFSGKDCTKVDRSACYIARYISKNIVARGLVEKCEIQLSYAIGVAEPTSVMVDTFGTGVETTEKMDKIVRDNFKLTPDRIIETLGLSDTRYKQTAMYGHFDIGGCPLEKTDKIGGLKNISNSSF